MPRGGAGRPGAPRPPRKKSYADRPMPLPSAFSWLAIVVGLLAGGNVCTYAGTDTNARARARSQAPCIQVNALGLYVSLPLSHARTCFADGLPGQRERGSGLTDSVCPCLARAQPLS